MFLIKLKNFYTFGYKFKFNQKISCYLVTIFGYSFLLVKCINYSIKIKPSGTF